LVPIQNGYRSLKIDDETYRIALWQPILQKVGEWVFAGNPYNLNPTVTAGIVSAKLGDLGSNGIQSFIQTDAAVNLVTVVVLSKHARRP
jgi:S1-C subfamily serine protease